MRTCRALSIVCGVAVVSSALLAQEVIQSPKQDIPLRDRWNWALSEGARGADGGDFWIGYYIKRLMREDSYIGSGNVYSGTIVNNNRSLYDIISGEKTGGTQQNLKWGYRERANIVKTMKDVALLFRMSGKRDGGGSIRKIDVSNMELCVDFKGKPLLWLGGAEDDQSVQQAKEIYGQLSSSSLKKELVQAIGIHQRSAESLPFLKALLKGEEPDDVRAQAAFWLGEQNNPDALSVLVGAARTDRSLKVREQSVFGVSQMDSDESMEALIDLARKTPDSRVRAKAAFWLGQKASQKAIATLEGILADDEETDVQRQALYALAQIHNTEGVDRLIKIAKTHQNPRIRKQAIQCLGQSDDPRALDALIEIVRK
jgi:hypothetical protein